MHERQVPMPYTVTAALPLLAQSSPVFTLGEHGALQGLPTSVTVHMKEACFGDAQAVRAALGDAMSVRVLMRVLGKGSLQCRLARPCALRSVAANGPGHVAL